MEERKVTFLGNPLTLEGTPPSVGAPLPGFTALDNGLAPVDIASFRGKVVVISVVPSLDTPVCDAQTRKFNQAATGFSPDVVVVTLSMDLPFAQKRWCGAAGVDRVVTLSDHRDAAFGRACGLLIRELRLLSRAVLVLDREGVVRYVQVLDEITHEPDYEAALDAVRRLG
ncbi:MAG: thiol peroxidase [Acidobacteria bacterium]|nr:thiol peroxidase [Acidobacteriota bacterium]